MTARITYETADGTDSIERDEWHNDKDGFITAYNNPNSRGTADLVHVQTRRVVTIERL